MKINSFSQLNYPIIFFKENFLSTWSSRQKTNLIIGSIALATFAFLALLYTRIFRDKFDQKTFGGILQTGDKTKLFDYLALNGKSVKDLKLDKLKNLDDTDLKFIAQSCPNLETLEFSHAKITDTGLTNASQHLRSLKTLILKYCQSLGLVGNGFKNFKTLEILEISGCYQIQQLGLSSLTHLKKLKARNKHISITGETSSSLEELISDDILDLDSLANRFPNLHLLKSDIRTHQQLSELNKCSSLKNLELTVYGRASVSGLADLPPSLETLTLRILDVDTFVGQNLKHFSNLSSLQNLNLIIQCDSSKKDWLRDLLASFPVSLKSLKLMGGIYDEDLQHLKKFHFNSLDLVLVECWGITDDGLKDLKDLPIRSLKLSDCYDAGLEVNNITFKETVHLSDNAIAHLKDIPSLKVLEIESLPITDAGLEHLIDLPDLKFSGRNLKNTTERGRKDFKQRFKGKVQFFD